MILRPGGWECGNDFAVTKAMVVIINKQETIHWNHSWVNMVVCLEQKKELGGHRLCCTLGLVMTCWVKAGKLTGMPQRTAASSGATETAVAVTHEQSLKVTQNILVALLSELAFVRGIFPEDSFSVSKSGKVGIPDFTFRLSRQQPLVSCLSPRGPRRCRGGVVHAISFFCAACSAATRVERSDGYAADENMRGCRADLRLNFAADCFLAALRRVGII